MPEQSPDDQLFRHVLGSDSPCESLLAKGVFPEDWVDRYLDLLATVSKVHSGHDTLPRRTVWAVQFASWYLPLRFEVWCRSSGDSNADTVGQLALIRTPSELFITDGIDH